MVKQALGVRTNDEAAALCGVPLRTMDRLFDNPDRSLMRNALMVSAATGISLDELFPGRSPATTPQYSRAAA